MRLVLIWQTATEAASWKPYHDNPEGRAKLLADLKKLQQYGALLLYWEIFRQDTAAIFAELTQPKGGDGGGVDC